VNYQKFGLQEVDHNKGDLFLFFLSQLFKTDSDEKPTKINSRLNDHQDISSGLIIIHQS